jgi:hypothetical protein
MLTASLSFLHCSANIALREGLSAHNFDREREEFGEE